jgi:hypothetical protein
MEQATRSRHYYTLSDAAKATGKDKRTLKKYRESGQVSAEPILEDGRIAGWKFDPAELARVFPSFRPLEQAEEHTPHANGHAPAMAAETASRVDSKDDVIQSYQAQLRVMEEALTLAREDARHTRQEMREERESMRQERAGLHKIIDTASQSVRLLTDERQRPVQPEPPPPVLTQAHYAYFGVILTLIAIGLLYALFFKA